MSEQGGALHRHSNASSDILTTYGRELVGGVRQWFGHALGGMAVASALACKESTPNKAVMGASAIQFLTAPLLMLHQRKDMKKEMIALNTVACLATGGLLAKHAFK